MDKKYFAVKLIPSRPTFAQVQAFMPGDPATRINSYEFHQILAVVKS